MKVIGFVSESVNKNKTDFPSKAFNFLFNAGLGVRGRFSQKIKRDQVNSVYWDERNEIFYSNLNRKQQPNCGCEIT